MRPRLDLATGTGIGESAARQNRLRIEGSLRDAASRGEPLTLPPGWYEVDRALRLASRHHLLCGGDVTIRNAYHAATFPENCTAYAQSDDFGYAVPIEVWPDGQTATAHSGESPLSPGTLAYVWQWDGYLQPEQTPPRRVRIVETGGKLIALSESCSTRHNALKILPRGQAVEPVHAGSTQITLVTDETPSSSRVGWAWLTDGPWHGNEAEGEWVQVVAWDGPHAILGTVVSRDYPYEAAICWPDAITGVRIEGATFAAPLHSQSVPLWIKHAHRCRIEDVQFGHGEDSLGLASCSRIDIHGCRLRSGLALNNTDRVTITGSQIADITTEEGTSRIMVRDCELGPSVFPAVNASQPTTHVTIADCRIAGIRSASTIQTVPGCHDWRLQSVRIGPDATSNCWLHGDRTAVRDVVSEAAIVMGTGNNQRVADVIAPRVYLGHGTDYASGTYARIHGSVIRESQSRWSES